MARASKEQYLRVMLRQYLDLAETQGPDAYPLKVNKVAKALGVSRGTLYKYGFEAEIQAAREQQRKNGRLKGKDRELLELYARVQRLRRELDEVQKHYENLCGLINIIEHNAMRLGYDPEELRRPMPKPPRHIQYGNREKRTKGSKGW